ncbi:MAG: sulfotransferase [Acidobacteriota bacterium]
MCPEDKSCQVSQPQNNLADLEGVFVVGCPRSGTSALAWALAQHPRLWTSTESDFLFHLFGRGHLRRAFQACISRPDESWLKKENVSYEEFCRFLGKGISALFRSRSKNRIWVDQSPTYTLLLEDLVHLFPNAKFLHVVRDGRKVVASMLASGFDEEWARDVRVAWETWVFFVKAGLQAEHRWPTRVMRVSQERMRQEPEELMGEVFRFLRLEYHEEPARFLRENIINSSFVGKSNNPPVVTPANLRPPASQKEEVVALLQSLGFSTFPD